MATPALPAQLRQVYAVAMRDVPANGHERATHEWLARTVARLLRLPYAGSAVNAQTVDAYCVPDDTLDLASAQRLGITDSSHLLGGVVPFAFLATKAVVHPLVPGAQVAVMGWNEALAQELADDTLPGYTAFCASDARRAFALLGGAGRVRLKLPTGVGGRGQWWLRDEATLHQALASLPDEYVARHGVVLEANLVQLVTFSVGEVEIGGQSIAYHGTQTTTADREGRQVYGGSDLDVLRGTLDQLLEQELPPAQAEAVRAALAFDRKLRSAYPQLCLSRRNYDVARGIDSDGRARCGVLEQSWRIGGATPAELGALELFAREPDVARVHAATRELHGQSAPPGAQVYFSGDDPRLGPLVKYLTVTAA
ncbi:MAG TPA: DUF3182 family protein [Stenotrophomonas sp.]|nr:DUF3182 family protein [Stenotrophomonas sp.]